MDVETVIAAVGTPFKQLSNNNSLEKYTTAELKDLFHLTFTLFNGICLTKKVLYRKNKLLDKKIRVFIISPTCDL